MSRLYGAGAELNTGTSNVEAETTAGAVSNTIVRSGIASFRKVAADNIAAYTHQFAASNQLGIFYTRVYLYIETSPSTEGYVLVFTDSSTNRKVGIRLTTGRVPRLWNIEDNAQVGSNGAALSTAQWYCLELKVDTTTLASTSVEARIDGVSFASGTINLAAGVAKAQFGGVISQFDTSASYYFDDFAINDSAGSFQNTWPGAGNIIHLQPREAGDNNQLGAASATNYQNADEVIPDDATTTITTVADAASEIDDYKLTKPFQVGINDTINLVAVGVRYAGGGATLNDSAVVRIKASASGTVEESAAITPSSTSYLTNANAAPRNYPLTIYDLPGASTTAWTKANLETAQIGVRKSTDSTNGFVYSALWAHIDYTPAAASGTSLQAKYGTYTGNGSTQTITGIGFKPDLVIVKSFSNNTDAMFRTRDMPANYSLPMRSDAASLTNGITDLTSDGFSLGSDGKGNQNAVSYYYIALKDNGNKDLKTFRYVGTGADGKQIVGLGFQPNFISVKGDSGITGAHKLSVATDTQMFFGGADRVDLITGLAADGFTVNDGSGSGSNLINISGIEHFGFAIKEVAGRVDIFSYTGNATDNTNRTDPGFQPGWVWIKASHDKTPVWRTSSHTGDNANTIEGDQAANKIQSFSSTGFQIGTDDSVNQNLSTYWGMAIYDPAAIASSQIKKIAGLTTATVKKISSQAIAAVKKVAGVTNV